MSCATPDIDRHASPLRLTAESPRVLCPSPRRRLSVGSELSDDWTNVEEVGLPVPTRTGMLVLQGKNAKSRSRVVNMELCGRNITFACRSGKTVPEKGFLVDACTYCSSQVEYGLQLQVLTQQGVKSWTFATTQYDQHTWMQSLKACLQVSQLADFVIEPSRVKVSDSILGQGAAGFVVKGTLDSTAVAIKCFKDGIPSDPLVVSEFVNEACILSSLRCHKSFVHMYGVTVKAGENSHLLLMEYLPNGNLTQRLHTMENGSPIGPSDQPLSRSEYLSIARDIASGLQFMHKRNLVHRDLKPANILFSASWHAKIVDFGVSREVSNRQMTVNIGTLLWSAPELMSESPASSLARLTTYTTSADIYSFGIILHEMLSRELPYTDIDSNWEVRVKVRDGTLRPPLDPEWPSELCTLMKWCWFSDPNGRPTASDILELLNPALLHTKKPREHLFSPNSKQTDSNPSRTASPIPRPFTIFRRTPSGKSRKHIVVRNTGRVLPTPPPSTQFG